LLCGTAIPILSSTPQVISSKRYRETSSIGLGSGLDPDEASEIRDSSTQREIDGSLEADLPELSLGQRLAAVAEIDMDATSGSDINDPEGTSQQKSKRKTVKAGTSLIPSNSLTRTLIQALHSSDSRLLEMCLAHTEPKLIRNTIRRLPPQLAIPLINACVERLGRGARGANMKGRGGGASSQRGMGLITWINTVLAVHSGHLMTVSLNSQ
jgi:U3 small nucleolar RNA-associated protein 5